MAQARVKHPLPDRLRERLLAAHGGLLTLHKVLLDHERGGYERTQGPIGSPGEFLQLLIGDPYFAWLRPVSGLVAQIDEFLDSREPVEAGAGEALLAMAKTLVVPVEGGNEFQSGYFRAMKDAVVVRGNAEWQKVVAEMERKG